MYFHDQLLTARIEGREGGREGGRELFCLFFHALSLTWVFEIIFTLVNIISRKRWDTKAKEGRRRIILRRIARRRVMLDRTAVHSLVLSCLSNGGDLH